MTKKNVEKPRDRIGRKEEEWRETTYSDNHMRTMSGSTRKKRLKRFMSTPKKHITPK